MTTAKMSEANARDKLIVALDVDSARAAREIIAELDGVVKWFKIGSQLFTATGGEIAREIVSCDRRLFLDLKFHDIPNTVAQASREAVRLGASLFNLHALGGGEMMRLAREATHLAAREFGVTVPKLIAVTILTSHEAATLAEIGINTSIDAQAAKLARLAHDAKLDGVVASAHEIQLIRDAIDAKDFLVITPGVRPATSARHDQKRVTTPADAVRAGADFLVVGRAITHHANPAQAAAAILDEMEKAISSS